MSLPDDYLRETHIIGPACREHMLDSGHFPVLKSAPFIWLGCSELLPPYRMVRLRSVHSHVVVPVAGRGRTVIDGALVDCVPGSALLGPVGLYHAFEAVGPEPWRLAWVFFDDDVRNPVLRGDRAELVSADGGDFASLLQMLLRESAGAAEPGAMSALVALLNTMARRIAGGGATDPRLGGLWSRVEGDLARDWDGASLARIACVSEEHLRRLCHRYYQRSPMNHLAHLRMRRAETMLSSTSEKVDEIARRVGYASMYSFSAAFRRFSGVPPSRFRSLRAGR